ncbi:alpha/beta fold hydrolase [Pseudomonas asplenii]|uniref:alpha/beta fold hydrolase n=1 Tax=Pseudomonas asplenii TaxID=53407 RepID=UPI0037C655B6
MKYADETLGWDDNGTSKSQEYSMFDNFSLDTFVLSESTLRVRHGGNGPPVLLLHGHPRTHATWHRVAPLLEDQYTVVCPDLRGFGCSSKPVDTPDHAGSSKRAKARDCVELMRQLGHERFAVIGHDRGAYTAFRLAMDHPQVVSHLGILDGVPIIEALERCDEQFATKWWHWFFFSQPVKPEQAILADPDVWYGGSPQDMGVEAYEDYHAAIHDPATVHTMVEDYRAGLGIDRDHDAVDRRAGRRIACPTLILWAKQDDLKPLYEDVLAVWEPWTTKQQGRAINCGHHMAEEAPEELAQEIRAFLRQ